MIVIFPESSFKQSNKLAEVSLSKELVISSKINTLGFK